MRIAARTCCYKVETSKYRLDGYQFIVYFLFTKSNIFFVVVFFVNAYKDLTAKNRPSNSNIFNS